MKRDRCRSKLTSQKPCGYAIMVQLSIMATLCNAYLAPSRNRITMNNPTRSRHSRFYLSTRDCTAHFRTTVRLSASVIDSEMNSPIKQPKNETHPQLGQLEQIEQVLSAPELLDPALVLEATIGITEPILASSEGSLQMDDLISDRDTSSGADDINTEQHDFKISHDDDLDLTRQIIMQHIEEIGQSEGGTLEWILDDDDEEDDAVGGDSEEQHTDLLQAVGVKEQATSNDSVKESVSASFPSDGSASIKPPLPQHETEEILHVETSKNREISIPSVAKILKYTIPAIGVWMCSPVLSMIDTASVGLLSGTAQQAALNPAVSVTDYGALVVAFMYTATTNLIAAAQAQDEDDGQAIEAPRTTLTLITALKLALIVGSVFGVALSFLGKTLIQSLIGNDSLDPAVMGAALRYVRIRSLGMPAALVIGSAQSACLGMQDVKSPLYVLLAAAIINFCGDVLLVPNANPWLGGAAGAAWATVLSQYGALVMFWKWMTTKPKEGEVVQKNEKHWIRNVADMFAQEQIDDNDRSNDDLDTSKRVDVTQGIMELTGTSVEGKSRRKQFRAFLGSKNLLKGIRQHQSGHGSQYSPTAASTKSWPKSRGFLADGKLKLRDYFSVSKIDVPTAKEFSPFVIPVTTTSIGRISGYIAMSHVASSTLGTFDMAAHQIIFSIFCCLTPIVDALSQVAQSFVPSIHGIKTTSIKRANALRQTVNNFRKVGAMFGLLLVSLVSMIPLISRYFTSDPLVLQRVNGAIPGVALFLASHGLMCAGEGSLLGQKDLSFLRNSYALFFFTVPAYMLRLKHRALAGLQTVGIGTMWAAFATYNVIRTAIFHLRLIQLQRGTNNESTQFSS